MASHQQEWIGELMVWQSADVKQSTISIQDAMLRWFLEGAAGDLRLPRRQGMAYEDSSRNPEYSYASASEISDDLRNTDMFDVELPQSLEDQASVS